MLKVGQTLAPIHLTMELLGSHQKELSVGLMMTQ